MKHTILLYLFIFQFSFSQNIDSLKIADTIYVYYKGCKGENKTVAQIKHNFGSITSYTFILNKEFDLSFSTSKYLNFDDFEIGKLADRKVESHKFLKIHKDIIITNKFLRKLLRKYSKERIYNWIQQNIKNKKKVFYLIDKDKNKNGKVFLFEVNPFIESYEPPWNDVEPLEIKIIKKDSIKN
jgi:hypothetical protein